MSDYSSKSMSDYWGKPLTSAIVGGAVTHFVYPGYTINVMGRDIPLSVAAGVAVGIGSVLAEVAHKQIYPNIGLGEKLTQPVAAITDAGIDAAGAAAALYLMNPKSISELGLAKLAIFGVGVDMSSDYLYWNYLRPWWS